MPFPGRQITEAQQEAREKMNEPLHQTYETIDVLTKYYENGLVEYCNPNTGKVIFSFTHPSGKSPVVPFKKEIGK